MFALIQNGRVAKYPYTVTDLRRAMSGISFPNNPSDATLLEFGVHRVYFSAAPEATASQVVEEAMPVFDEEAKRWTQVWTVRDLTADELQQRSDVKAAEVRAERNDKLTASDWTQVADAPVDKAAWATYRQALRDISEQSGFPWNVTWPDDPFKKSAN